IVLTGFASRESAIDAVQLGAYSYIEKPYELEQLLLTIRRAIEKTKAEQALRESEHFNSSLLANAPHPIIVINSDTSIQFVNPSLEKLTGFTSAELIDLKAPYPWWMEDKSHIDQRDLEAAMQGGVVGLEKQFQRKDSERFWVEVTSSPITSRGNEQYFLSNWVDITDRKQADDQVHRQLQYLRTLKQIDLTITSSLDANFTLNVLVDQVTNQLDIDAADVLLYNQHTRTLTYAAGRGFRTEVPQDTSLIIGEGFAGRAALDRRTLQIPDLSEVVDDNCQLPFLREEQFVSYYAIPLLSKGIVLGVFEIFHRSFMDPDNELMDFLEALASQAAIAIDNATLFEEMHRANLNLIEAYDETLEGWVRALDMYDQETQGHTRRVTETTVRLARTMGIGEADIVHVRRGAMLHDIGKMGISDAILNKPGSLNEEEWKIMRQHPVKAYEMLSGIDFLRLALDIPYCHHEKWNGSGYPRGLKGKGIPLPARIFSVVDVWDALRSDRPYRPAWQDEKALEYIQSEAGKHFDPKMVEAFFKNGAGAGKS
ncbi:MAG: PAS domain S-box protein, partial [Anaerolineales bacterium]|nr:PAS domain S-box protein [Anaerolineales bacterium]